MARRSCLSQPALVLGFVVAEAFVVAACGNSGGGPADARPCAGDCAAGPTCGDGVCLPPESSATCCRDCGCPSASYQCSDQGCRLPYPFADKNMFFGLNFVLDHHRDEIQDLGISYFSIQYRATWYGIEYQRGAYDWTDIDGDVKRHQGYGADSMICLTELWNAWGADRQYVEDTLLEIQRAHQKEKWDRSNAWIFFNRDMNGGDQFMPDPQDPNDANMIALLEFVTRLVERYDGDGVDDMPGLIYPVRYWHLVNELPGPGYPVPKIALFYKALAPAIRATDDNARIVLPGLYSGPQGRILAFANGFISDDEAGVRDGVKHADPSTVLAETGLGFLETSYQGLLRQAYEFYDIVDIHLYLEKDTFIEGLVGYLRSLSDKPIVISEGKDGPFKVPDPNDYPECNNGQGEDYLWSTGQYWSAPEHAEQVVKANVILATVGVERRQFGISSSGGKGYWKGPWCVLGLLRGDSDQRNPAYYVFKMLLQRMWEFDQVSDVSPGGAAGSLRVYKISAAGKQSWVAWDRGGRRKQYAAVDLSRVVGEPGADGKVRVTFIVTEVDAQGAPVIHRKPENVLPSAVPVGLTPVFVEAG